MANQEMSNTGKQQTSTKPNPIYEGFMYGFFSTLGALACVSLYANREKVKRVIRYAIQEV